ncbi:MAG: hypothetical protein ACRCUI_01390, partial [Polymorphobacter sp.]
AILAATPGPRIIIFAGSNGRFSHSCAQITADTGIACVNLSNIGGVSLKFQLDDYIDLLQAGDLIYLPLEYRSRAFFDPDGVGDEAPYLLYNAPARMPGLYGWRGLPRAVFGSSPRTLVTGLGEMALHRAGVERRFGLATLNAQGDETGHDAAKAAAFRTATMALPQQTVDAGAYADRAYWGDLRRELARLQARGVILVGGYPTTFDDSIVPANVAPFLTRLYADAGGCFIALPNRSLYPRDHFYDTAYHLTEAWQRAHSQALAPQLAAIFKAGRCPSAAP